MQASSGVIRPGPGHHHFSKLEYKSPDITHQPSAYLDESRLTLVSDQTLVRVTHETEEAGKAAEIAKAPLPGWQGADEDPRCWWRRESLDLDSTYRGSAVIVG